jgi:hypothetical protein
MLMGQPDTCLLLYHVFDKALDSEVSEESLDRLKKELREKGDVRVDCRCEESSDFIGSLDRLARHIDAQLIVMGITGKSKIEQMFFGSNTLKMAEKNPCPVLIIPPTALYSGVKNVVLTSDLKDVQVTIPYVPIKKVLSLFQPALHIINVNSEHYVSLTEEYLGQRSHLLEMFQEFNPEFYFIGTYDFQETVNQFVHDKNIDMLVTIPRNRSMFSSVFKSSHTKKLVYETAIPILAAHE